MAKKITKQLVNKQVTAQVKKAKAQIAKAKKQLSAAEKKVTAYTKKSPQKALAIAAGVGVALGAVAAALLRRKKK